MPHPEETIVDIVDMDVLKNGGVKKENVSDLVQEMEVDSTSNSTCDEPKEAANGNHPIEDSDAATSVSTPNSPPAKQEIICKDEVEDEVSAETSEVDEESPDESFHFKLPPFPGHLKVQSDKTFNVTDEESWSSTCKRLKLKDCCVKAKRDWTLDAAARAWKPETFTPQPVKPQLVKPRQRKPAPRRKPGTVISTGSLFVPSFTHLTSQQRPITISTQPRFGGPFQAFPIGRRVVDPPVRPVKSASIGFYKHNGVRLRQFQVKSTDCLKNFPPTFKSKLLTGKGSVKYHPCRRLTPDGSFVSNVYVEYTGREKAELNYSWMGRTYGMQQRRDEQEALIPASYLVPSTQIIKTNRSLVPGGVNPVLTNRPSPYVVQNPVARPSFRPRAAFPVRIVTPTVQRPSGLVIQPRMGHARADHAYGAPRPPRIVTSYPSRLPVPRNPVSTHKWYKEPEPVSPVPTTSSSTQSSVNGSTAPSSSTPSAVPSKRGKIMIVPMSRLRGDTPAPPPPPPPPKVVIHRVNGNSAFGADDVAEDPLNSADPLSSDGLSEGLETKPTVPAPAPAGDVICID